MSLESSLKTVLSSSRIDTIVFSAHSYRSGSLTSAYNKRISLNDILKTEDWNNAYTFVSHYFAHTSDTPVGQIILNESTPEG